MHAAVNRVRAAVAAAVADLPSRARVGVACSGGADSVALADAAVTALGAKRVVVLHVDHQLQRGSAAVGRRVAELAAALGCEVEILPVKVAKGASLEDQARAARYAALEAAATRRHLACVLAGHTARDQAETVLLRVLRGTGPGGLAGIPARRGIHRRPLIELPRADIEAHVAARRLVAIADPMNDDRRFARVRMRKDLMPALAAENPRLEDALCRLARSAGEWAAHVDGAAAALVARGAELRADDLAAAGPAIGKRALQLLAAPAALDADHLDAAWALVTAPARGTRGVDIPGARIERAYSKIVVRLKGEAASDPELLVVEGPDGPYAIRPWRPGDRMRPARLRGRSRKLSDLYVDARIPRSSRGRARVVVAQSGEIVWAEHVGPAAGATIHVVTASNPDRSEG